MKINFGARLTLLLLALFVLVQLPTFYAFYYASRQSALGEAQQRLESGTRAFNELLRSRGAQLLDTVQVTISDFGFKQAVASGDNPTIHSVLYNQAHRIGADLTVLTGLDGRVVASMDAQGASVDVGDWSGLLNEAEQKDELSALQMIGGKPYELTIVPVRAPTRIAWIGMGFALDDRLAQSLKNLSHIDVTFVAHDDKGHAWLSSTLPEMSPQRAEDLLAAFPRDKIVPQHVKLGAEDYFTLLQPLRQGAQQLTAVLQFPGSEALQNFGVLQNELIVIAALSFIASLAGAIWLSRKVTRSVSVLASAARRIEAGDYRGEVPVTMRDELGDLANAFKNMQHGIARREQEIAYHAFHDSLTGLPNRASLQRRLHEALERAHANRQVVALMMLDIDRFKEINDTMGHAIGDRVLIEIGRRLKAALRPSDMLVRFGGDEFVALIENIDGVGIRSIVEGITSVVTKPVHADAMELFLDVSVGMALYPQHGESAEELLRRADIAMYEAKQSHTPFRLYENGRDALHLYRLSLVNDLRRAINNNELELFYQPKLNLKLQRTHQVEALLRWMHPERGMILPTDFIPLAENAGIIRPLTDWVLHEAIRQCSVWKAQGMDIGVAINVSGMDLSSGYLPELLVTYLGRFNVLPQRLTLEITETAVMRDAVYSQEVLNRLKQCGVCLAIDDFGTGYSSLSHLKRLPVDELKIDKSFVTTMATDGDDAVIVRSTIELAHNMGLHVVAEGVESDESLAMLRGFRCDTVQGYLISRPLTAEMATLWLQESIEQAGAPAPIDEA